MSNQQANISQVSFFLINLFSVCVCAQLHPALCHIMDSSPPGSSVHGSLQARILEWVAISYSGDLPNPGIETASSAPPAWQTDSLPLSYRGGLCIQAHSHMIASLVTVVGW